MTTRAAPIVRAAVFSGAPSTAWALLHGNDPLAAARAAGTLLPGRRDRPGLVAGLVVHAAVSVIWGVVIGRTCRTRWQGALAGLAVAALDLGVVGRRYPAIRALPQGPQWADHVAFGVMASGASARRG